MAITLRVLADISPPRVSGVDPEPLEHPVPALEPGRDGLAGEGGGHHGQRDDARDQEVHPPALGLDQRFQGERDQQQHRDEQGQQQLLTVAQGGAGLQHRLGGDHRWQGRRARRRAAATASGPTRPAHGFPVMTAAHGR
jgi:hypothetical protein